MTNRFDLLIEELTYRLLEVPIIEMASERMETRKRIKRFDKAIWIHIFCILLHPDQQCQNYWRKELRSFFSNINDELRGMCKRFDSEEVYSLLVNDEVIKLSTKEYRRHMD